MYTPLRIIKQYLPTIIILKLITITSQTPICYFNGKRTYLILLLLFFSQLLFVYYHITKLTLDRATSLSLSVLFFLLMVMSDKTERREVEEKEVVS